MSQTRVVVVTSLMRAQRGRNAAKVQDQDGAVHVMPVDIYDDWQSKLASGRYAAGQPFVFVQERHRIAFISGWYTVQIVSLEEARHLSEGVMPEQLASDSLYASR
jgi:hypothetical protein